MTTTFPSGFPTIATVTSATVLLADNGTSNGTATAGQIAALASAGMAGTGSVGLVSVPVVGGLTVDGTGALSVVAGGGMIVGSGGVAINPAQTAISSVLQSGGGVVLSGGTVLMSAGSASQVVISAVTGAVNQIGLAGNVTGSGVQINAAGTDTNIDLTLTPKGTGHVVVGGGALRRSVSYNNTVSTSGAQGANPLPDASVVHMGTVAAGCSVTVADAGIGSETVVINRGANSVTVYMPVGQTAQNSAVSIAHASATARIFRRLTATLWDVI